MKGATGAVDNKNTHNTELADIKGSYINRIYMKSSMLWLYIITIVLSYAHKLPYIGRIITLLSLWYGRTTWWKILIKIRKVFIVFNAIIGVLLVFKTTGFSSDNIFAGIAGMGHTYLEIFYNFSKRLFYWFVELFDHKIVPNVPNNPPSNSSGVTSGGWFNKAVDANKSVYNKPLIISSGIDIPSILDTDKFSLRSLYKDGIISTQSTPWYREWSTWLWIVGIAGVAFIGYKFIIDPLFIESLGRGNTLPREVNVPQPPNVNPNITVTPASSASGSPDTATTANLLSSGKKLLGVIMNPVKLLNPFYWLPTTSNDVPSTVEGFMQQQASYNFNNKLYPFTPDHPFDSLYHKLRLRWLGETHFEESVRLTIRRDITNAWVPDASEASRVIASVPASPSVGTIGLSMGVNSGNAFEATSSFYKAVSKFNSLPGTPNTLPSILPNIEGFGTDKLWDTSRVEQAASTSSQAVVEPNASTSALSSPGSSESSSPKSVVTAILDTSTTTVESTQNMEQSITS
jgi:hypothetical protein